MYFPYFHNISIEDLYDIFSNYESSDQPDLRKYFNSFINWKWRIIFRDKVLKGKITFNSFSDFYKFIKFAYIVYPTLNLSVFYEKDCYFS